MRKCIIYKMSHCVFILFYSTAGEVLGILNNYLLSELPLDIENVRKGATTLHHLKCTLGTACQGLHRSALFTLLFVMNWKWIQEASCSVQTVIMQCTFCTKMHINKCMVTCVFLCSSVRLTRLSPVWKPWPRCLTIRAALWHTAKHRCDKKKKQTY